MSKRNFWLWLSVVTMACGLFAPRIFASTDSDITDDDLATICNPTGSGSLGQH